MILLKCPKCRKAVNLDEGLKCQSCNYQISVYEDKIYSFFEELDSPDLQLSHQKWDALYQAGNIETLNKIIDEYKNTYFNDTYYQVNQEKPIEGSIYLEIGCGEFVFGNLIASKCKLIIGVDFSLSALHTAKLLLEKRNIKNYLLIHADINKLPVFDSQIDIIYGGGVIEHFENTDNILSELYRVLKKGGISFNTVPALNLGSLTYRQVWGNIPSMPILKPIYKFIHIKLLGGKHMIFGFEMSFTRGKLIRLHKRVGFKKIKVGHFKVTLLFSFLPGFLKNIAIWISENISWFSPMHKVIGIKD